MRRAMRRPPASAATRRDATAAHRGFALLPRPTVDRDDD
jgi:hypothetical protein